MPSPPRPPLDPAARMPTAEAVQPSLWDRLADDLPAVRSEIRGLTRLLERRLGAERLAGLRAAPPAGPEPDLTEDTRRALADLAKLEAEAEALHERGIVVSTEVLRAAVRRDVEALFNAVRYDCTPEFTDEERARFPDRPVPLDDFPEVRRSVVNYGIPAMAGHTGRDFDREALAAELKRTLEVFEPRFEPASLEVEVQLADKSEGGNLRIVVRGVLRTVPAPERLTLRTLVNLDSGRAATREG